MKKYTHAITILLFIAGLSISSCKKDETTPSDGNSNPTAREVALNDYNANYLGTAVTSTGWTGSTASCTAGLCSSAMNTAVIKRINYFRRMVGLNDECTLDASLYSQEQETALMMTANNQLNHYPPTTWTCYTSLGALGASSSNIALGFAGTASITGFINDFGTGNEMVGHRRWILHSRKQSFSYGATNNSMALYVASNDTNSVIPDYIAYPPKGYVPAPLVFARWSFGIPGANFASANVSMTGPGGVVVPVNVISNNANGYGDNTIVWEPTGVNLSSTSDLTYNVIITNVGSAPLSTYNYDVVIFKP